MSEILQSYENIDVAKNYRDQEKIERRMENIMERKRPVMEGFEGHSFFTAEKIARDRERLNEKLDREFGDDDVVSYKAETLLTYELNSRISEDIKASPASEYDDHLNGIDIVCTVMPKTETEKRRVFALDVCTAMTKDAVDRKMRKGDFSRGEKVPKGCSRIDYYNSGRYYNSFAGIPRFVVGFSPKNYQEYVNSFEYDQFTGDLNRKTPNTELKFKVLSEILYQAITEHSILSDGTEGIDPKVCESARATCKSVVNTARKQLMGMLCANAEEEKFFSQRLYNKAIEYGEEDPTYKMIMSESFYRANQEIKRREGRKAIRAAETA